MLKTQRLSGEDRGFDDKIDWEFKRNKRRSRLSAQNLDGSGHGQPGSQSVL